MVWICDDHGYHTGPEDCPGCLRVTIVDRKKEIERLRGLLCHILDEGMDDYWAVVNTKWVAVAREAAEEANDANA